MIYLNLVALLVLSSAAFADGDGGPSCGDFLAKYVVHRENAFLILPLENGDADTSRKLRLKTNAEVRHYLEENPDDPWARELVRLPQGYFREHVVLRTEIGPTSWRLNELEAHLELVKSRVAANVPLAKQMLLTITSGDMVPNVPLEAQARLNGRTLQMQDDRGTLWLARAIVREGLIRHKLAVVDGQLKTLDEILTDDEIFFYAAFPELVVFWSWRNFWNLRLPDPLLRVPAAIELPPVQVSLRGECDVVISREAWRGTEENVELRLRVRPRCGDDGWRMQRWFKERWEEYLDLLAQKTRGEVPETPTSGPFEVDFDSRSTPRGLGFYVFLNERLK